MTVVWDEDAPEGVKLLRLAVVCDTVADEYEAEGEIGMAALSRYLAREFRKDAVAERKLEAPEGIHRCDH